MQSRDVRGSLPEETVSDLRPRLVRLVVGYRGSRRLRPARGDVPTFDPALREVWVGLIQIPVCDHVVGLREMQKLIDIQFLAGDAHVVEIDIEERDEPVCAVASDANALLIRLARSWRAPCHRIPAGNVVKVKLRHAGRPVRHQRKMVPPAVRNALVDNRSTIDVDAGVRSSSHYQIRRIAKAEEIRCVSDVGRAEEHLRGHVVGRNGRPGIGKRPARTGLGKASVVGAGLRSAAAGQG